MHRRVVRGRARGRGKEDYGGSLLMNALTIGTLVTVREHTLTASFQIETMEG